MCTPNPKKWPWSGCFQSGGGGRGDGAQTWRLIRPLEMWAAARDGKRTVGQRPEAHLPCHHVPGHSSEESKDSKLKAELPEHYEGVLVKVGRQTYFNEQFNKLNQIRSVAQSCPTLCDSMNHSTPGLPVHHQLPEFTQTHVRVSDAIQPSHPLSSPSPPAPNPSQHQSLFQ